MQIIDAQIHLWGTGLPSNLSHRQVTAFTPEEAIALMDEGGVDAAVIHPPGWDPNSTDMAFQAVRNYPGRFAIMGAVPLDRPESRTRIASWREQPGMLGLRYGFFGDPARRWLHDGTLNWLWAAAENAGVPIAALATDSLTELGRIAEEPVPQTEHSRLFSPTGNPRTRFWSIKRHRAHDREPAGVVPNRPKCHVGRTRVPTRRVNDGGIDTAFVHQPDGFLGSEGGHLPMREVARQAASPEVNLSIDDLHHALPDS